MLKNQESSPCIKRNTKNHYNNSSNNNNNNSSSNESIKRECRYMLNSLYSRSNAEHVMAMFSSCNDAIVAAKACDLQSNWETFMLSIYRNVIQQNNTEYMMTLHSTSVSSLPAIAFEELSERFLKDKNRAKYFHAFKKTIQVFLEKIVTNLEDVQVVLHSIAGDNKLKAMGFDDLQVETNVRLQIKMNNTKQ